MKMQFTTTATAMQHTNDEDKILNCISEKFGAFSVFDLQYHKDKKFIFLKCF